MKKAILGLLMCLLGAALLIVACSEIPVSHESTSDSSAFDPSLKPTAEADEPTAAPQLEYPSNTQVPASEATNQPEQTYYPNPTAAPAPASDDPVPTQQIIPIESDLPTAEPVQLATFSFADNDLVPIDLDYDGIFETVSLVPAASDSMMKLVIESDSNFSLDFDISSLVCAYATDFCFGDGSAELVVSYVDSNDEYVTAVVGSFSSDTPVSCSTVEGWVEEVSDEGFLICRVADILGKRGISRMYTYDTTTGEFVPLSKEWTVYSYEMFAILGSELRIEIEMTGESNGEMNESGEDSVEIGLETPEPEPFVILQPGTALVPVATDYYSYIVIETVDGIRGIINVINASGIYLLEDGTKLDSLFSFLPQW